MCHAVRIAFLLGNRYFDEVLLLYALRDLVVGITDCCIFVSCLGSHDVEILWTLFGSDDNGLAGGCFDRGGDGGERLDICEAEGTPVASVDWRLGY